MANRFTSAASDALGSAMAAARSLGHTYIGTEHLLLGRGCCKADTHRKRRK